MKKEAIQSMMNPVRLMIMREITKNGQMTTKEIQSACGDISQATLYRHLSDLRKNDIIHVVAENQIRGTIEKVYAIKVDPMTEIRGKVNQMTKKELSDIFSQFIISLLSDYDEYIKKSKSLSALGKEFSMFTTSMFLTDEETVTMIKEIQQILKKNADHDSQPGRRLRKVSTILSTSLDTNIKGEKS